MEERLNYLIDLLSELKDEINNLQGQLERLKKRNEDLIEENETLKLNAVREANEDTKKHLDEIAEEQNHSVQEESDFYFETYNAARDYLKKIYGNEANKLRTERDVEAFFIRHGKKLIIKNND